MFHTDLSWGEEQELKIVAAFPNELVKLDGFNGDILVAATSHKIEIKSERRSLLETPNYAVELTCSGNPSGPFKAKADECLYYGHYFPQQGICHLYRTADFLHRLDTVLAVGDYWEHPVGNAVCAIIHRDWFTSLEHWSISTEGSYIVCIDGAAAVNVPISSL